MWIYTHVHRRQRRHQARFCIYSQGNKKYQKTEEQREELGGQAEMWEVVKDGRMEG